MKSNTTMEKDLDNYYKQIAKALPAGGRKALLPGIREGVEAYLAENPDATMDDVIAYVGTPECIAGEYYANQDGREITQKIKASRIILIGVVSVMLAALLFFTGFTLFALIKGVLGTPAYSITELEIGPVFEDVTPSNLL